MAKLDFTGTKFRVLVLALAWSVTTMTHAGEESDSATGAPRNVAIFIHDGVELLDFAGPGEVFAATRGPKGPAFKVYTVADSPEPIVSQGFVKIVPEYTFDNCPPPDILVLPGGKTLIPLGRPHVVQWIRDTAPNTELTVSVCTGALLLAKAGLLQDRPATTHWASINLLRTSSPKTEVRENVRFVDSGEIVTSAGVSAGIDMALHVVERLHGTPTAEQTARYMEYDWRREAR